MWNSWWCKSFGLVLNYKATAFGDLTCFEITAFHWFWTDSGQNTIFWLIRFMSVFCIVLSVSLIWRSVIKKYHLRNLNYSCKVKNRLAHLTSELYLHTFNNRTYFCEVFFLIYIKKIFRAINNSLIMRHLSIFCLMSIPTKKHWTLTSLPTKYSAVVYVNWALEGQSSLAALRTALNSFKLVLVCEHS